MKLSHRQQIALFSGILIIIFLIVLVMNYRPVIHELRGLKFNQQTFIHVFRGQGLMAILPLTLLVAAVTVVPGAPNSVMAVISGICLGAPLGFIANVVGLSIGNMIGSFLVDRLEDLRKQSKPSRILDDLLKMQHPKIGVLLGYCVPFVPNALVHIAASDLKINRSQLNELIILGSIPTAFFYAFGGDAVLHLNITRLIVAVVIVAASAGLILIIRRDRKKA